MSIGTYPYIVLLEIVLGIFGTVYNKVMKWIFELYKKFQVSIKIRPFVAYLFAGVMFFAYPQVLGSGHNLVEMLLNHEYTLYGLAALFLIKFVFSLISFTSDVPGGIFLPILVQGAILGCLFGRISRDKHLGL